jgi:NADPH:quinone reductase-like Zn-dependent oxidoreductase
VTSTPSTGLRTYEIRINGHLDIRWASRFDGMTLTDDEDGTTVARGALIDQAALHGVLQQLRDAGLPLISVVQVDESTTMKAAVSRRFGGPEVVRIEEVERPVPAADEILIKVRATTVSAADHRARSRDVPAGLLIPSSLVLGVFRPRRRVLGMDAAGVVVAVGDRVPGFEAGDEVLAMLGSRFGGHAGYAIAKATDAVAIKPASLSFEDAASLIFGGITARGYLSQTTITTGTRVLVNGASGAVGTAMVQLAKAAGAHVTGVSGPSNRALVTSLGADRAIDYRAVDFAAEGFTYDVIVDCVGNAPVSRVLGSLEPGGTVLLVAGDLRSLVSARGQASRHGITVVTGPGPYRSDDLQYLADLAARGALQPTIDRTFPIDQISAAHLFVDSGRKRGSVVVTIPS